jgi:hypothetical protein
MQYLRISMRFSLLAALGLFAVHAALAATTPSPALRPKSHTAAQSAPPSVEVINGVSRMTENFDAHQKGALTPKSSEQTRRTFRPEYVAGQVRTGDTRGPRSPEKVPANGVVIFNGNQKETRVFNASHENGPRKNQSPVVIGIATDTSKNRSAQPVVVGISSNAHAARPVVVNIASAESNAQPVVVGVASSGSKSAAPVSVGVSPRPAKRPPYRPASLDAQ